MAFDEIRRKHMETSSTCVALRLEDYAEVLMNVSISSGAVHVIM
jgi:hypothetical protein